MLDIVGKRYWYFLLSLFVIVPGVISLALYGLPLAIDFTGGSLLEIQFTQAQSLQPAEVKGIFSRFGFDDSIVQTSGTGELPDTILVRTKEMDTATKAKIETALEDRYGKFVEQRFESVGPAVGTEVAQRASWAVLASAIAILLYISFAFRHVPSPFRYGVCAIIAMIHDILVVVGLASIFGKVFGWEVDALFLTALLTVIGFSVHDTIVVFDRIRENITRHRGEPFEAIVNHSIIQTLDRSINTQLTVLFTLLALTLFGGLTIRHFVVTLLVGIFSGTYSSIFNAAALLIVWENGEIGQFFRRLFGRQAKAAT
jgi:preprotein translocase subunit SecF